MILLTIYYVVLLSSTVYCQGTYIEYKCYELLGYVYIHVDNCFYRDIRLYGGSSDNEGMVQLCNSTGGWEAVCDHDWRCRQSLVACQQLRYIGGKHYYTVQL